MSSWSRSSYSIVVVIVVIIIIVAVWVFAGAVVLERVGGDVFDNAGVLATELHPLHSDDSSRSLILQHHQEVFAETKR